MRIEEEQEKNSKFSPSTFFMKISGEVILRAFFGQSDHEQLYFDQEKKILLSEELVQIIQAIGYEVKSAQRLC